jgi:hypothetical protein
MKIVEVEILFQTLLSDFVENIQKLGSSPPVFGSTASGSNPNRWL